MSIEFACVLLKIEQRHKWPLAVMQVETGQRSVACFNAGAGHCTATKEWWTHQIGLLYEALMAKYFEE